MGMVNKMTVNKTLVTELDLGRGLLAQAISELTHGGKADTHALLEHVYKHLLNAWTAVPLELKQESTANCSLSKETLNRLTKRSKEIFKDGE